MRIAGCLAGMLRKISPKPQGTEYIPCRESLGSERWIIAVTLQSKPLPFRSAYQVTVLHFGDFVLLFVCLFFLYTHKKTVDFIYFCIVLHFIFMGRFYGLFFYLRTLCFKMVWFTVPMEKKSNLLLSLLLPLPVQCKKTTLLLTPLCTTLLNVIRGPGSANQQPGPCQYLLSLCGRR